jgi:hypothetical protein
MTIVIALLVIPFIPDFPLASKRWWLDREQQLLAVRLDPPGMTKLLTDSV